MILPTPIPKRLIQQLQQSIPRRVASQLSQHMIALSDTFISSTLWQQEVASLKEIYPPLFLHIGYLMGLSARESQQSPLQVLQEIATHWHTDAEHMVLEIVEETDFKLTWYWQGKERRELNSSECELLASQCTTLCRPFLHGRIDQMAFDFPVKKQEYDTYCSNFIIGPRSFEQTEFVIRVPRQTLMGKTLDNFYTHSSLSKDHARHAHQIAESAGSQEVASPQESSIPLPALFAYDQTVNLIIGNLKQVPTLAALAQTQTISERTLKRRLREANCHFQQLLTHIRFHHTLIWLYQSTDSISVIADRLGYASVANFSKAFRQWCGVSPSTARAQLSQAESIHSIREFRPSFVLPPMYW